MFVHGAWRKRFFLFFGWWVLVVLIAQTATALAASTECISLTASGKRAGGGDSASISADGRFVAFKAESDGALVSGDTNGKQDVFLRDRLTKTTVKVSHAHTGGQTNGDSVDPVISPDGRFVVFTSHATNVVTGDTNGKSDVFIWSRLSRAIYRVSVSSAESQANGHSYAGSPSTTGRYVVFTSEATRIVAGDTNGKMDAFVRDIAAGTTRRISVSSAGAQGSGDSYGAAVSGDGRFVAFGSSAKNLVAADTNGVDDIFVRDVALGITRRESVSSTERQYAVGSYWGDISAGGRYVSFQCGRSVLLRDMVDGTTVRVASLGPSDGEDLSGAPQMSDNGAWVAFGSYSRLVPSDTNSYCDAYIWNRLTKSYARASYTSSGRNPGGDCYYPSVSADGQHVAFLSYADALLPTGVTTLSPYNVFMRNR